VAFHHSIGNIKIAIYDRENHGPPHIHVRCDKDARGRIVIETMELYKKDKLPSSCLKTVREWMEGRQAELLAIWREARERQWQEGNKP
jgi:hypothetical protein